MNFVFFWSPFQLHAGVTHTPCCINLLCYAFSPTPIADKFGKFALIEQKYTHTHRHTDTNIHMCSRRVVIEFVYSLKLHMLKKANSKESCFLHAHSTHIHTHIFACILCIYISVCMCVCQEIIYRCNMCAQYKCWTSNKRKTAPTSKTTTTSSA